MPAALAVDHRQQQPMVEINLNAPTTPEERQQNMAPNVPLRRVVKALPYIDGHEGVGVVDVVEARQQHLTAWAPGPAHNDGDAKAQLRFFSVGPASYQIRCPLCNQRADTETVQMAGALGSLSCLLSLFSCCIPIFSLSFVYFCLQSRLKSKRMFCNKCGGYLGFYRRPT